jgi:pimeloyl-ACP methyl ester carboxylesterase
MAVSVIPAERPSVEIPGGHSGELADVIALFPPDERGFSYPALLTDPTFLIRGAVQATSLLRNVILGRTEENPDRPAERVLLLDEKGREHLHLVTEPDPKTGVKPKEAVNSVFFPGLSEMGDSGSALHSHNEHADRHPEERTITRITEGVSRGGNLRYYTKNDRRRIEHISADTRFMLPRIVQEGPVKLRGNSLGTFVVMEVADQDLAANDYERLNIQGLRLLAPAVVGVNVPEEKSFRGPDIDEEAIRRELTNDFLLHLAPDLIRMMLSNPKDMARCAPILGAYLLSPHKAPGRAKAIRSDFNEVQRGVEWSVLERVTGEHETLVVGGELDPLVQFQTPQWVALDKRSPGQVRQKIVPGKGHLIAADSRLVVREFDRLETQSLIAA